MAQTKPKASQFYGVSGEGTAGQVLISDGNGGMSWGANTENYTVSWATPTGQGLTYTQPSPQSSNGAPNDSFPSTTFTATSSTSVISGTATIAGLPTGITTSQSISGSGVGNVLTVTIGGVFPGADSLNTALTISGLTLATPVTVEYFAIGGGATGGSGSSGGGGGAGGLYTGNHSFSSSDSATITIGAGATGRNGSSYGNAGSDTTITGAFSITAGGGQGNTTTQHGGDSGTGSSGYPVKTGGTPYNHGANQYLDGGGAGIGANGENGSSTNQNKGADGGVGTSDFSAWAVATSTGEDVSGTRYYGGGGGAFGWQRNVSNTCGNNWDCSTGQGGSGGGGNGMVYGSTSSSDLTASNGLANTGGGAGGGSNTSNGVGSGGSGICIMRYSGAQAATGGTIVTTGGYTYHTFTASGTFTKT